MEAQVKLSDRLDAWLRGDGPKTLGSLIALFGEKSFAVLFVILLADRGASAADGGCHPRLRGDRDALGARADRGSTPGLVAAALEGEGPGTHRAAALQRTAGEADPLARELLGPSLTAFLAPPFTGLDTLPAMGVVVISLGIFLEDSLIVLAGTLIGALGVFVVIGLGRLIVETVGALF